MRSSRITTLFTEPPPFERGPSSFAVSIVVHCIAFVWLYFGLKHVPQINDQSMLRHFTVRLLRQESIPEPRKRVSAGSGATRSSQSQRSARKRGCVRRRANTTARNRRAACSTAQSHSNPDTAGCPTECHTVAGGPGSDRGSLGIGGHAPESHRPASAEGALRG